MTADVRAEPRPGPGTWLQIFAFGGGMVFYAVHLLVGVALIPLACDIGATWPVHLLTIVALAGILGAGAAAFAVAGAGRDPNLGDPPLQQRRRFLGRTGLFLNGLALLIVAYSDFSAQVLNPCLP